MNNKDIEDTFKDIFNNLDKFLETIEGITRLLDSLDTRLKTLEGERQ